MIYTTTKERVIQYLLSKDRNYNDNKISVDVGRKSFSESEICDIGEEEFINQISILETEGLIRVNFHTAHRDLKYYITIDLYASILNYFNDKKSKSKSQRMGKNLSSYYNFWNCIIKVV